MLKNRRQKVYIHREEQKSEQLARGTNRETSRKFVSLGTEEEQVQNGAVSEEVHDRGTLNWMLECSISALLLPLTGYVTLGK